MKNTRFQITNFEQVRYSILNLTFLKFVSKFEENSKIAMMGIGE